MQPTITLARTQNIEQRLKQLRGMQKLAAYVGIPEASIRDRQKILIELAAKFAKPGKKAGTKRGRLVRMAAQRITNAQILFIFSKGSAVRNISARPVLEPAVASIKGRAAINPELTEAARSMLSGDRRSALRYLNRAAMAGRNVARQWFFDPSNAWAPNAPRTIRRKGSDRPGIDSGAMRNAITGLVKEE